MNFTKDILKGIVIGVANVIPGVSGGTMAVSMGIYERLISSISNLFRRFLWSIKQILPILIGVLIGIVGLSFGIEWMFAVIPLATVMLFIGLILGGIPMLLEPLKGKKITAEAIIVFIAFLALVVLFPIFGDKQGADVDMTITLWLEIKLIVVGIIASATMVVPGVSGSMMLMLLGYYHPVIGSITTLTTALATLDVSGILSGAAILLPFGIGVVVGIFLIAKIIEWLLGKYPVVVRCGILGLVVGSPVGILLKVDLGTPGAGMILLSVLLFLVGAAAAYFLGKTGKEKKD